MPKTFEETGRTIPISPLLAKARTTNNSSLSSRNSFDSAASSSSSIQYNYDDSDDEDYDDDDMNDLDFEYSSRHRNKEPLNDEKIKSLIRTLELAKKKAEKLVSVLKQGGQTEASIRITDYGRNRTNKHDQHYSTCTIQYYNNSTKRIQDIQLAYCVNIPLLLHSLGFNDF